MSSINVNIRTIAFFFNWLKKEKIKAEQVRYTDIVAYIQHCKNKNISPQTLQNYINAVRIYYNHLQEQGSIKTHPAIQVSIKGTAKRKIYSVLEPHELNAIYHRYESPDHQRKRNKAMLGLFVYQGITTHELDHLLVSDVKLKAGEIEIPGGKRSTGRTLSLEAHQVIELYQYIQTIRPEILGEKRKDNKKLFVTMKKGGQMKDPANKMAKQLKQLNPNVKDLKQIRASVIVKWLRSDNLREAQYKAGHRYISSTEKYIQSEMQGLQEEVNEFHPLN